MISKRRDAPGGAADPLDSRSARRAALDILARRDHFSVELLRKLRDKGCESSVAERIVGELCAEKLLDDRRYALNFVAFHAARGQGPVRVRADLRQRGVPDELVTEAVDAYDDWIAQLRKAREKKFGAAAPTDYADGRRQARFLGYRGYTGSQIRLAMGFDTDIDAD